MQRQEKSGKTAWKDAPGDPIPLELMKNLRRKSDSESGGSSNGTDQSEDSALVSLGNTSFGFNFDCEDGGNNKDAATEPPKYVGQEETTGDGAGATVSPNTTPEQQHQTMSSLPRKNTPLKSSVSSLTSSTNDVASSEQTTTTTTTTSTHTAAAANAVASLQSLAQRAYGHDLQHDDDDDDDEEKPLRKRKADESSGYNSDDEKTVPPTKKPELVVSSGGNNNSNADPRKQSKKKKKLDTRKREERNAREKERSFRIAKQINELRGLLSSGGVIVPKGTKSSVLTEAANYIRMLQQHQYRSEM